MSGGAVARIVDLGDLDELTREIDRLCERRAWDDLVLLRDLCRAALERGRQLWPAAAHAEYRLALEAPGSYAARVLVPGAGRFTLGPLPEVAASTHAWNDLAPHVQPNPVAATAAHERVVRGEDLRGVAVPGGGPDLPLVLQPWEPPYALAHYEADRGHFPAPPLPATSEAALPASPRTADEREGVRALVELAAAWTTESNGRAQAVAVLGDGAAAIAALGVRRCRVAPLTTGGALAWMAWAAASGGAHGRRRGAAAGRFAAWWALAVLAGLDDDWPVPPEELGEAGAELRWYAWDAGEPDTGWALRLAVEDPGDGLAWALAATDART